MILHITEALKCELQEDKQRVRADGRKRKRSCAPLAWHMLGVVFIYRPAQGQRIFGIVTRGKSQALFLY